MIQPTTLDTKIRTGPIGVMADIHANPLALDAVRTDGAHLGVKQWIVLGDVVALGPDPVAVLQMLEQLNVIVAIAGNTERYVLTGDRPPPSYEDVEANPALFPTLTEVAAAFGWTKGFLTAANLLSTLTTYIEGGRFVLPDGTAVLAIHASLRSDDGVGINPDSDEQVLEDLFPGVEADVVLGGHTHLMTDRRIGSRRFLNPGSVSNPHGQDKGASYMVLHCSTGGYEVEHRSVGYDVDAFRDQIRRSGFPGAGYLLRAHFADS